MQNIKQVNIFLPDGQKDMNYNDDYTASNNPGKTYLLKAAA